MLKQLVASIAMLATIGVTCFSEIKAAEGPLHGRPRYEKIDGKEWIFYLTQGDTDWYLEPNGQLNGDIFRISARGVSPGTDNYGVIQIECRKKLVSAYYEPWQQLPKDSRLINGLYKDFCNLP